MGRNVLDSLVVFLRNAAPDAEGDDSRLLARFCAGDELAFAALVHRYAPLVWGVCRRTLARPADAEDAFQAAFVVLFRKAKSLSPSGPLGPFLHAVACRVAAKARQRAARHAARESPIVHEPAFEPAAPDDLRGLIDEEVGRLPEKYRRPIVLCYLEGLTNEQAAERLGCPKGTILSRLSRGRDRLRERLGRRGVELPSLMAAPAVPAALVESAAQAGPLIRDGGLSTSVLSLAEGALFSMSLHKMKLIALTLIALTVLGGGAGLWASRPAAAPRVAALAQDSGEREKKDAKPKPKDEKKKDDKPKDAKAKKGEKEAAPLNALELHKALAKTVPFPGIDDPKTTLREALDQLVTTHKLAFLINEKAFRAEAKAAGFDPNTVDIEKAELASTRPLPKMRTALRTALRQILGRIPSHSGATYLLRKDHIEITTVAAARKELELPDPENDDEPVLPPLIHDEFARVPLEEALRRIAEDAEVNVVIDARVEKKANVEVSATFRNAPIQTALELLADQAELAVVKRGNAFYVTSQENAARMSKSKKKE